MKKKTLPLTTKTRIHRGDTVRVLLGKDRGKKAAVLAVFPKTGRVIVEGVNMVKKHIKARKAGEKGQRVNIAAPMNFSNIQLICPSCKKGTRVQIVRDGDSVERRCKQCQAHIPVVIKKR